MKKKFVFNLSQIKIVLLIVLNFTFLSLNAQVEKLSLSEYGANINPNPQSFCEFNSSVYFTAKNSNSKYVLWKLDDDGNAHQISLTSVGGNFDPNPTFLVVSNDALYFSAADASLHRMLWKIDSDGLSQVPLTENGANTNPYVNNLFSHKGNLYFSAKNRIGNLSFWKIDSENAITEINFEEYGGSKSPEPKYFSILNDVLYFNAKNSAGINTLWKTVGDGFIEINMPSDIVGSNPNPRYLTAADDKLFFAATDKRNNRILWHVDANDIVKSYNLFNFGINFNSNPEYLCYTNGSLYFKAVDLYSNNTLWKLNSESNIEKIQLLDQGGALGSWPSNMTSIGNDLYFRARDKYNNWNLWFISSYGKIKKIPFANIGGDESPTPTKFFKLNDKLFFNAKDSEGNYQLWKFTNNFVTSVWNGQWSNGVPDKNTDVIIDGNFEVNGAMGHFECLDLDIMENSRFAIHSNKTATVYGNILNKGIIRLNSEESERVGASLITYGEVVNKELGNMQMSKIINTSWSLISSPMTSFVFTEKEFETYAYEETGAWQINEDAFDWTKAKGYLTNSINSDNSFDFSGLFNSENIEIPVSRDSKGLNLVGNPYPSAIDWNSTEWTDKGNVTQLIYTYSEEQENYTYYSENTNDNYPGGVLNNGSSIIPAMQAFFVQAKSDIGAFKVSSKARIHENRFKGDEKTYKTIDYCVFKLKNENYSDEVSIRFIEEANGHFDSDYDALKLFSLNTKVPQIFTYTNAISNSFAINSQKEIYAGLIIPIGIKAEDGNYTISAKDFNFSGDFNAILYDNKNDEEIEITESDYSFVHTQSEGTNRFSVRFTPVEDVTGIDENNGLNAQVYSFRNELFVKSAFNEELKLELFDLAGTKIYATNFSNDFNRSFDLPTGNYLVKLTSQTKSKVQKIYFSGM